MHPIPQCQPTRHSGRLWWLQPQPLPRLKILSANPPVRCLSTTVTVVHYPAGANKWNPIEHIFFSSIHCNWAGRPLKCWKTILNYIRSNNKSGLKADAVWMTRPYQTGIKIRQEQMDPFNLIYNEFCLPWNYTINPETHRPPICPH